MSAQDVTRNILRTVASSIGLDPNVAEKVWLGEGGVTGSGQSTNVYQGVREKSYGPLQLYYGNLPGRPGGLGQDFTKQTGVKPGDAQFEQASIKWGLTYAKQHGWGAWSGAAKQGITGFMGFGGTTGNNGKKYVFPLAGWTGDPHKTYHTPGATDLMAPVGTPALAIVDGVVSTVFKNTPNTGNGLIWKGDDGKLYFYAHLKDPPNLQAGDRITAGQKVGEVGNTGNAANTASHLHVGIGDDITNGTGPSGGAGTNFDAQSFLAQLLASGGSMAIDPGSAISTGVHGLTDIYNAITNLPGSIGSSVGSAIGSGLQTFVQWLWQSSLNWFGERGTALAFWGIGGLLIVAGMVGLAIQGISSAGRTGSRIANSDTAQFALKTATPAAIKAVI